METQLDNESCISDNSSAQLTDGSSSSHPLHAELSTGLLQEEGGGGEAGEELTKQLNGVQQL
jgi:hypothetical protein